MGLYFMSILLVEAPSILHVRKLVWSKNRMSWLLFVNGLIGSVLSQEMRKMIPMGKW